MRGEGQQAYETGVDLLHTYRGDPADLRDVLRLFQRCGSAPYAQAGIGYVLVLASYEGGDDYDADGLRLAGEKPDMARSAAPGRVEIEFLGALIPVLSGRLSGARPVLDHLATAYPAHYFVSVTEMYYWYEVGDVEQFRRWYRRASEQADTESRRKDLLNRLAGLYTKLESWENCIEAYRQLGDRCGRPVALARHEHRLHPNRPHRRR